MRGSLVLGFAGAWLCMALVACGGDGGGGLLPGVDVLPDGTADPGTDGVAPGDDGGRPDAVQPDGEAPDGEDPDVVDPADNPVENPGTGEVPASDLSTDEPAGPDTPSDCSPNGDVQQVPCGGLNGRAVLEQTCTLGTWKDTAACADPDLCVDDDTRTVPCQDGSGGDETQECQQGRWVYLDDCHAAAECTAGNVRTIPCGLNGNGDQPQSCTDGAWGNDGDCADPDECTIGAARTVNCGINSIGRLQRSCPAGTWVDGPCTMNLAPRASQPKALGVDGGLPWVYRIVSSGDKAFIQFEDDLLSIDVWVWDPATGTATPMQPRFIRRGQGSDAYGLKPSGDRLFLLRDDGIHGMEAWLTDGTEDGTDSLGDLNPGREGIYQSAAQTQSATFDGTTYFYGALEDGWHLFASTSGGTGRDLGRVNPGDTAEFGTLNGAVFFNGHDMDRGCTLWRTDGTAAGTSRLVDFAPDSNTETGPQSFATLDGRLYFVTDDAGGGRNLWRTDGTAEGTVKFLASTGAIVNGGSSASGLLTVGSRIFFTASGGGYLSELWQTDGTVAGTKRLTAIGGGEHAYVSSLVAVGDVLYFDAVSPGKGRELYRFPLTGANPQASMVKELFAGSEGSGISHETELGGLLYFGYKDATGDVRPYVSDGTAAGTRALGDTDPRLNGWVQAMARVGDSILIAIKQVERGHRIYRVRPGQETTEIVLPGYRRSGLFGVPAAALPDGRLVFGGDDAQQGPQPWISDGTELGTQRIGVVSDDVDPLNYYTGFARLGDAVVFRAGQAATGMEPWVTSGTAKTTRIVKDVATGADGSYPGDMAVFGDDVFFPASTDDAGREPWMSDGTEVGTRLLHDAYTGTNGSNPAFPAGIPPSGKDQPWTVLFAASTPDEGVELWAGTGSSARLVLDIVAGRSSSEPRYLATAGNAVYFSAYDETNGRELWRSDGTAAGTALMKDGVTGADSACPDWLVPYTDARKTTRILYAASGGSSGRELWASSGPGRATAMLADLSPKGGSDPAELHVTGDTLLMSALNGAKGRELLLMDLPTGAVTRLDLREGALGSDPHGFFTWDDTHTFFSANDGVHGQELWVTDGTVEGTAMAADLDPGAEGSFPWILDRGGDLLYVQARTADHGNQLFVLNLATRP